MLTGLRYNGGKAVSCITADTRIESLMTEIQRRKEAAEHLAKLVGCPPEEAEALIATVIDAAFLSIAHRMERWNEEQSTSAVASAIVTELRPLLERIARVLSDNRDTGENDPC